MNFSKARALILTAMLAGASLNAVAAEKYVDPIQKGIDIKHKAMVKKLEKDCGSNNRMGCLLNAKRQAAEQLPNRGSVAYSKTTYSGLSKGEAKAKVGQLINLFDKLQGQSSSAWDGKLKQSQVESEVRWLMSKKLNQDSPDITSARMYLGLPVR